MRSLNDLLITHLVTKSANPSSFKYRACAPSCLPPKQICDGIWEFGFLRLGPLTSVKTYAVT